MKILVTGGTGTVGGEVLAQALRHPGVTHVVALVRRQLPVALAASEKLTQVLVDDFETWTDEVVEKCKGVEACIWTLGIASQGKMTLSAYRNVNVFYLQRGLEVCADKLVPNLSEGQQTMRFIYLSGLFAERDASKSLWMLADARRIRGEGENVALEFPAAHSSMETAVFRPGGVLGSASNALHAVVGATYSVKLDVLAAALLEAALHSTNSGTGSGSRTVENAEIIASGKRALEVRQGKVSAEEHSQSESQGTK